LNGRLIFIVISCFILNRLGSHIRLMQLLTKGQTWQAEKRSKKV